MAVKLESNNGHRYSRASVFSAAGNAFTISAWVRIAAIPSSGNWRFFGGMSGSIAAGFKSIAGPVPVWTIGTSLNNGDSAEGLISIATWYHVALTRNGTSKLLYVNRQQVASLDDAEAGATTFVLGDFDLTGSGSNVSNWDGDIAAYKVWDGVALTASEIAIESLQYAPQRCSNLRAFYPLWSLANDETDHYGAQTLTVTQVAGAIATSEGPPLPWRLSRARRSSITIGGGTPGNASGAGVTDSASAPAGSAAQVSVKLTGLRLIDRFGQPLASLTDITVLIYKQVPTTVTADKRVPGLTTNGSGILQDIEISDLQSTNAAVWVTWIKDGTPARGNTQKVTPVVT